MRKITRIQINGYENNASFLLQAALGRFKTTRLPVSPVLPTDGSGAQGRVRLCHRISEAGISKIAMLLERAVNLPKWPLPRDHDTNKPWQYPSALTLPPKMRFEPRCANIGIALNPPTRPRNGAAACGNIPA
jgi:hypothetical protein